MLFQGNRHGESYRLEDVSEGKNPLLSEAGFQAAEVCDDDPWRNYDANCIQLKPWDREDEDEETSGGDDRWNDHCFSSPCDTDVAVHSDVHHTGDGSDTISQFIEHWKLRWDETEEILHGLTPEEVDVVKEDRRIRSLFWVHKSCSP